jgi:hypothetical protein
MMRDATAVFALTQARRAQVPGSIRRLFILLLNFGRQESYGGQGIHVPG